MTMVAVTLAVTGGAVAASYAALSDAPVKKGEILYPYTVAQQPSAPTPTTTAKPPATEASKPGKSSKRSADGRYKPLAKAPLPSQAPAAKPAKADSKPKAPEFAAIKIPATAGALYDPAGRGTFLADDPHDPTAAYDDDNETSWAVTAGGEGDLLVGYVLDLKHARALRRLELLTDTPGFSVAIYGTESETLPAQVNDPGWVALKARDNVDGTAKEGGTVGDGEERITLADSSKKYRYVLLWFTKPAPVVAPDPPSRTVRLFDIKLYG